MAKRPSVVSDQAQVFGTDHVLQELMVLLQNFEFYVFAYNLGYFIYIVHA